MKSEAFAQSQARYEHLFDFAPVGYLVLGEDGGIQEMNLTAAQLLGTRRAKAVKRNMDSFLSGNEHGDPHFLH